MPLYYAVANSVYGGYIELEIGNAVVYIVAIYVHGDCVASEFPLEMSLYYTLLHGDI